jgi:hypothetical protein
MEFDMQLISVKRTGQWKRWFMPLVSCVLLVTGVGVAAELGTESGVLRSREYTFKHISSQQAQDFLSQLHIGRKYNALTPEILIVTSDVGSDFVKATAIAGVLDQTPEVRIETLAADGQSLPKPEAFMADLESITVGTLAEAPPKGSVNPAIIDVIDNKLIAIASESTLSGIKAAFQKWEKENQVSSPENAAAAPQPPIPVEPNLPPVQPVVVESVEAPMEPVLLPLVPEPNTPVQPVVEATASKEPLESVARQLFEASSMAEGIPGVQAVPTELTEPMAEPNEPAAAAPAESAEDFLSEGLLEELAEAGQQTEIEPAPDETTVTETTGAILPEPTETPPVAEANEPPREETSEDASIKMLQALMAQARAEKEQIAAQAAQEQPEETGAVQTAEPAGETNPVQNEIEQLRQKLAELEAKSATADTPSPKSAAESKIQTPQTVRTEPQIAPKLAEEELETVMDLPQEVELESLVDLVGKQLGLNYMYDPLILKNQKVLLKVHGGKIKVKDVYSLLESVLKLKGFVMTRNN